MDEPDLDLLIIGGGLIGATLLLALADKGISTLLVETQAFKDKIQADFDARSLALSPASIRILKALGLWSSLEKEATPIKSIEVSQQYYFSKTRLYPEQEEALGYVVEMQHITLALHQRLNHQHILAPAEIIALDREKNIATIRHAGKIVKIKAKMIVAADGFSSIVRKFAGLNVDIINYHQQAIVANIGLARDHKNWAYERFTQQGPLALLPLSKQRVALVWCLPEDQALQTQTLSDEAFLKLLQDTFGYKLGRFIKLGKRTLFPLKQAIMPQQALWPIVFIGNAAHTLHPVAGQGFNLSLRDVATFAQCVVQQGLNPDMLNTYLSMRLYDQQAITSFTHKLVQLFTTHLPGIGKIRSLGLGLVDNVPFLKNIIKHHAQGFSGTLPDLVCGIALKTEKDQ